MSTGPPGLTAMSRADAVKVSPAPVLQAAVKVSPAPVL
jgi:hypothetical protein